MPKQRVIALLDLDCFYAQVEAVRLGIAWETTPMVVLQWGMVLAVSYPARELGIKRGDYWNQIKKIAPTTMGIHVEMEVLEDGLGEEEEVGMGLGLGGEEGEGKIATADGADSRERKYHQQFNMDKEEKQEALKRENGYIPDRSKGKASLERYRYCSGLIFDQIRTTMNTVAGAGNFILEKASIDELYLDLTKACDNAVTTEWAAHIIETVRRDVKSKVGYTMSAGISKNKTMAKLTASFCKPNGLSVLTPSGTETMLRSTKMRKVRNFGGKLGKKVLEVVMDERRGGDLEKYEGVTMMEVGLISVDSLMRHGFGRETAAFIFGLMNRGDEDEEVEMTKVGAPTKSITCFKDFKGFKEDFYPNNASEVVEKLGTGNHNWISLLSTEVAKRVEDDEVRNGRYPKTLAVLFGTKGAPSKSRRCRFPTGKGSALSDAVVKQVTTVLKSSDVWPISKLGVVAENFEERGNIAKAFQGGTAANAFTSTTNIKKRKEINAIGVQDQNINVKNRFETTSAHVKKVGRGGARAGGGGGEDDGGEKKRKTKVSMSDEELAREMQRKFDKEVEFASRRIGRKTEKKEISEKAKLTGFFKKL
ncbi:hypothetical protein TrRE_jg11836 [Triparma retinervis]|uniref:UmuC domain-containing protein n=1 Tax=Triparma retinervis TaxID=2557542 RepID=A0A9W7DMV8_9STRA|nr:hypothetical protein TrRE_jg11836 [Triparma retinervis]